MHFYTKHTKINSMKINAHNYKQVSLSLQYFFSILLVGIVVLSILMHITQLISHSVSVPHSNTCEHQQSNHSNNYVCEVVVKPTADVVNYIKGIIYKTKQYDREDGKQLIESSDGIEQTYEQSLHGVRTLGTNELKHSSIDQHVGERRESKLNKNENWTNIQCCSTIKTIEDAGSAIAINEMFGSVH